MRPPRARREKPKVSAFTSAKTDRILALKPDLVLGFSDLQADIAAGLARAGLEVHLFNHRSVAESLRTVRVLGGMIGCEAKAAALAERLAANVERVRAAAAVLPRHPRVYCGMDDRDRGHPLGRRDHRDRGGVKCFPNCRRCAGRDRIIADPMEVVRRAPDLISDLVRQEIPNRSGRGASGWSEVRR